MLSQLAEDKTDTQGNGINTNFDNRIKVNLNSEKTLNLITKGYHAS